jgi:hypothetical protein
MTTRANILLKDEYDKLWFYRHADGYPEAVVPDLKQFMQWVEQGRIRNNVGQAAGWLILLGVKDRVEMGRDTSHASPDPFEPGDRNTAYGWKAGVYEPTIEMHGDIEYYYEVDFVALEIRVYRIDDERASGRRKIKTIKNFDPETTENVSASDETNEPDEIEPDSKERRTPFWKIGLEQ